MGVQFSRHSTFNLQRSHQQLVECTLYPPPARFPEVHFHNQLSFSEKLLIFYFISGTTSFRRSPLLVDYCSWCLRARVAFPLMRRKRSIELRVDCTWQ